MTDLQLLVLTVAVLGGFGMWLARIYMQSDVQLDQVETRIVAVVYALSSVALVGGFAVALLMATFQATVRP